jgi:hypothetical protein
MKLFKAVIYEFSYYARIVVSYTMLEKLARGKHSSLIQKFVNCGRKKFYNMALEYEKNFFLCNLQRRQISWSVYPFQAFPD